MGPEKHGNTGGEFAGRAKIPRMNACCKGLQLGGERDFGSGVDFADKGPLEVSHRPVGGGRGGTKMTVCEGEALGTHLFAGNSKRRKKEKGERKTSCKTGVWV